MKLPYYFLIILLGSGFIPTSSSFDFYPDQSESSCQCEKGEKGDPGPPGEKVCFTFLNKIAITLAALQLNVSMHSIS